MSIIYTTHRLVRRFDDPDIISCIECGNDFPADKVAKGKLEPCPKYSSPLIPPASEPPKFQHAAHDDSPVEVTYYYRCCAPGCVNGFERGMQSGIDKQLLVPWVPDGWRHNFGLLICPNHKLTLKVDGHAEILL
jgi:hypothetical protein